LYVFDTIGDTVSVGRDKKKCGIVLPINAQGVSRVHGSLKWINENELSFFDSSTYGTSVNGTLVKDRSEIVRDGDHIFVGDVELTVSFPSKHLSLHSTSSDDVISSKQGAAVKRKSVADKSDGSQRESKRSKLNANVRSAPRQSQISSFLVKKPLVIEEEEDNDCAVLAEDTPLSQTVDSVRSTTRNMVSFVKDSVGLSSGLASARFTQKPDNTTSSSIQMSSRSTARRKKDIVLAEDTQPETAVLKLSQKRSVRNASRIANNVTTCIPDTCDQNAPLDNSQNRRTSADLARDDTAATVCTSTFAPKAPLSAVQTRQLSETPSVTQITSKPAKARGTSIVGSNPVKEPQRPVEIVDGFSDDELAELIADPPVEAVTQSGSRSSQKTASVIKAGTLYSSSVLSKPSKRIAAKKTSIFDAVPSKKKPVEAMDSVSDEAD
ncbi:FHA domain protein, partial [Ostertagia ostertagi]